MSELIGMTFAQGAALDRETRTKVLGGKGAGLARMVDLGLPVPPGFTLTTDACRSYLDRGWNDALEMALVDCLADLERTTGKTFGDSRRPLLVSVRSGAPVSMPGMMDTVLNAGMTDEIAASLGKASGDPRFGWDTFRRFVQSYVVVVLGAPSDLVREISEAHLGDDDGAAMNDEEFARAAMSLRGAFADKGYAVPAEPLDQLRQAVRAVFASWNGERARTYRRLEGIADDLFTAVNVQMMAFGNLGDDSGTGVAFSRCPSDGHNALTGDFLRGAQGEDVVAGTHQTQPITDLKPLWPDVYAELEETARQLEHDLRYVVDIEFTVERGSFWMLQYRRGKHSPRAALRLAIDMAEDPDFPLTREEALERVEKVLADPPMLPAAGSDPAEEQVLATGLAAAPGRAVGAICTSVDEAVSAEGRGEAVILVRRETSPADIAGMAASVGILTTRGGHVSHAAVVARGWGLPAVVGAKDIEVAADGIRIGDRFVASGTEITIDGSSGKILLGAHQCHEIEAPEVATLRAWQRNMPGQAPAAKTDGYREEATAQSVSRALALKGMGDTASIATVLGCSPEEVAGVFDQLAGQGDILAMPRDRFRPSPDLAEQVVGWYAETAELIKDDILAEWEAFHEVNDAFKQVVTDWQMREVDGAQVINDHSDAEYDTGIMARIGGEIHPVITPIIKRVAQAEPRLIRYLDRLKGALKQMNGGDKDMVAHPLKDSYHTVWFELHEELIRLSGRQRTE